MPRIYLDNAATSWPKPGAVYAAVEHYLRENGAPAGRSGYSQAMEVEATISAARMAVARLIGATSAQQIIFTTNGTEALNFAIHGLLRRGDHAICTAADHNSVLRPLRYLEAQGEIAVTRVPCNSVGLVDPDEIRRALRTNTRLVVTTHASNVTGVIEPVAEIGRMVREHGARFLVDAAQTVGHLPVAVDELHADLLAAPAHKGLLGPLGTGFLYIRPGLENELQTIRQGGTGTRSHEDRQPETLPDKFETGNHNVPGLVGLAAALRWLQQQGIQSIWQHEQQLTARLRDGLRQIHGVTLHGISALACSPAANMAVTEKAGTSMDSPPAVGVVSISIAGYDPQEAAAALDANFGVQVRAGLHCAPLIHQAMNTLQNGGTVRFSVGPFTTPHEIEIAIGAVAQLARAN
ncbi:MAG TPA: aminotransferase class V-fold PLP-dependent enzyme [Pirellulales bacterium]|jgi:cysteine desulfurase family protein|nr:aminotransferase class V-fold PLP-dependent enzyme [Pirellulales bacterium]